MERRDAALVFRIRVRAGVDQQPADGRLRVGISRARSGDAVVRIVQRLGTTPVLRPHVRALCDEVMGDRKQIRHGAMCSAVSPACA
jgi:hypothetical protein